MGRGRGTATDTKQGTVKEAKKENEDAVSRNRKQDNKKN